MPSQYVVLQYGNVMTGEYLNIGVFAFDMDSTMTEVKSYFVNSLNRIDTTFGHDLILHDLFEGWLKKIVTKDELEKLIKSCDTPWTSLQVIPARGSLENVDDLLAWAAKTFLVE